MKLLLLPKNVRKPFGKGMLLFHTKYHDFTNHCETMFNTYLTQVCKVKTVCNSAIYSYSHHFPALNINIKEIKTYAKTFWCY